MKPIDNAGTVLARAWSMWVTYVLIVLSVIEAGMQALGAEGMGLSQSQFAAVTAVIGALIVVARVTPQPALQGQPPQEGRDG